MNRKLVWLAAMVAAVVCVDVTMTSDADAQMLRRLMGRRDCCTPCCGTSDCCNNGCEATSGCATCGGVASTGYEAAQVSYDAAPVEAAPMSYEAAPMNYEAAPMEAAPMMYESAPMSYEAAPIQGDCGCGGAVSYQAPMMDTGCVGCGQISPVSYDQGMVYDGATMGYEGTTGDCVGCGSTMVEGSVVDGTGCPQGGCGGEVVYEEAAGTIVDSGVVSESTEAPISEETSTTVDAPEAPVAPAEEAAPATDEDREA